MNATARILFLIIAILCGAATNTWAEIGASDFIVPDDRVDVILTRGDREVGTKGHTSETILTNVRVLASDPTAAKDKNSPQILAENTFTLELTPAQVEIIMASWPLGILSLTPHRQEDGVVQATTPASTK
jgi:pilus assembly protein CpaB